MRLIDADALRESWLCQPGHDFEPSSFVYSIDLAHTIDAVPIQFVQEVIEYLAKCRDNAIHEETQCAWDEQRQTLIMLLHEWAAWNECGRTGKYGERREG